MAEISRRSGRRIIESIDTKKASKQQVYDFYKRMRAQQKRSGAAVEPLIKMKDVKKADIVAKLQRMEQIAFESRIEKRYKQLQKELINQTPSQAAENVNLKQFEKNLRFQSQQGLIDIKKLMGGSLEKPFIPEPEPAIPEAAPEAPTAPITGGAPVRESLTITRYQGRIAHDLIASWVDSGLIDNTDDYDDSDEIWEFMAESTQKNEEYDFFSAYYAGMHKLGTKKYYDEFKEFLQDSQTFESDMRSQGEEIPEYGSQEYWDALADWREEQNNRPF